MAVSWLEVVAPIVRDAGKMAERNLRMGKNWGTRKKFSDWVTETDKAAEAMIIDRIRHYFPDHQFLGEEGGVSGESEHCWVIDPLDGTTNYVHGFPCFAVSVAYCYRQRPLLGIVYNSLNDDIYTAADGNGAHLNGERIRVSKTASYSASLFLASGQLGGDFGLWPLLSKIVKETDGLRRTGSTVLDMALLAAGKVDALISGPVNYWDVAAGSVLVREAGGFISDIDDRTRFVFGQRTETFVAANPQVFARYFSQVKLARPKEAG